MIKDRTGEVRKNNFGTLMKIVCYRTSDDIDVEFQDDYHYVKKHSSYANFRRGNIKNPYDKTRYGVGYLGVGKHTASIDGEYNYIYDLWADMLNRCYNPKGNLLAYYGKCAICDEWLNFQHFGDWYEENEYKVDGRLHIDKDIKCPGNTVYSPETCILVPQRINELFTCRRNNLGLPVGIRVTSGGNFTASYNGKGLGTYKTLREAFDVYATNKEQAIKSVAKEYKDIIPLEVYEALLNYRVLLENDKNYVA